MAVINQVGNSLTGQTGTGNFAGSDSPEFTTQIETPVIVSPTSTDLQVNPASGQAIDMNITGGAGWTVDFTGAGDWVVTMGSGDITFNGDLTVDQIAFDDYSTGGIVGTATNDDAPTGYVGEFVSSAVAGGSAVGLSSGTPANVTSISLTAGDWDVWGNVGFTGTASGVSLHFGAVSTTSAGAPSPNTISGSQSNQRATAAYGAIPSPIIATGTARVSISTTTTVYLIARAGFSSGTSAGYGKICARRVR